MDYVIGGIFGAILGFALGYCLHWLESIEERLVDYRFGIGR